MRGRETLIAIGIIGSGVDSRQSNSLASLASPATPGDLCANDADGARPASGALRRHLREYMSFPEESQPITAGPEFHLAILNPQSSIGHRPSSIVHRPSSIVNRAAALSLAPFSIMHHLGPGLSCCLRTRRLRGRGVPLIFGLSASYSYCVPLRLTAAEIRRTAQSEKTADLLPHFPNSSHLLQATPYIHPSLPHPRVSEYTPNGLLQNVIPFERTACTLHFRGQKGIPLRTPGHRKWEGIGIGSTYRHASIQTSSQNHREYSFLFTWSNDT